MSLIREVLNIPEPIEAVVKEIVVNPPEDLRLPYKIEALALNGEKISLEAYSVYLECVMVTLSTNGSSIGVDGSNSKCCIKSLKLSFPRGAYMIYDWGVLRVIGD